MTDMEAIEKAQETIGWIRAKARFIEKINRHNAKLLNERADSIEKLISIISCFANNA